MNGNYIKVNEGEIPQYYVENDHEAIIDPETFDMVQREVERRGTGKKYHSSIYPFSGKIRCGQCGGWYGSKVWHSNDKYRRIIWQCNRKFEGDERCTTPHLTGEEIQAAFLKAANSLLSNRASVAADAREMMDLLFDTAALEEEQAALRQETEDISRLVRQCIEENARTALDQDAYRRHYDSLVDRFNMADARLKEITREIHQRQLQRASACDFLKAFEESPQQLTEFSVETWQSLIDHATVYSRDDIRFTFKNGQEVKA